MPADQLDNLLVNQKNTILEYINRGRFAQAQSMLAVVREMWVTCNYAYKIRELNERIRQGLLEVQFRGVNY